MKEVMRKRWLMMVLTIAIISMVYLVRTSLASNFPAKDVYEQTSKRVVLITARSKGGSKSLGSGSIISDDGLVLTNAHVVDDQDSGQPCSDIRVFFKPDKVTGKFDKDLKNGTSASVVKFSPELDLALLSLKDTPLGLGKIEMADPEEIRIGEEVIAIGHPEHGGLWSLTYGRISGSIENYGNISGKDVFQTDTNLNRGNSGGPLLDQRGYLAAVNSNIARLSEDNLPITGVNFAIKSSVVKSWLNQEGYSLAYGSKPLVEEPKGMTIQVNPTEESKAKEEKAPTPSAPDSVPEQAQSPAQEKVPLPEQGKAQSPEQKKVEPSINEPEQKQFQTPIQPYDRDALFRAVEADLEDMMKEMRQKIRPKK